MSVPFFISVFGSDFFKALELNRAQLFERLNAKKNAMSSSTFKNLLSWINHQIQLDPKRVQIDFQPLEFREFVDEFFCSAAGMGAAACQPIVESVVKKTEKSPLDSFKEAVRDNKITRIQQLLLDPMLRREDVEEGFLIAIYAGKYSIASLIFDSRLIYDPQSIREAFLSAILANQADFIVWFLKKGCVKQDDLKEGFELAKQSNQMDLMQRITPYIQKEESRFHCLEVDTNGELLTNDLYFDVSPLSEKEKGPSKPSTPQIDNVSSNRMDLLEMQQQFDALNIGESFLTFVNNNDYSAVVDIYHSFPISENVLNSGLQFALNKGFTEIVHFLLGEMGPA